MNNFLNTVAISYVPLHEKAVEIAKEVGIVEIKRDNKKVVCSMLQRVFRKNLIEEDLVSSVNM